MASAHATTIGGELAGRVAIVTGAAGGIGLATARCCARAGAILVLADCDEARGSAAAATLAQEGRAARFIRADVSREDDVRALVSATVAAHGALHAVFNNAGIKGSEASVTDVATDEFERVLAVNLTGTFLVMKHAIAAMLAGGGGAVVNNASISGLVGSANHAAYCASKGGVVQLTRSSALEFAARGVRVNCICPGFVDTDMVSPNEKALVKVLIPMGRIAKAEEIAELAVFLASDRASYVTGAVFPVDGGYVAR